MFRTYPNGAWIMDAHLCTEYETGVGHIEARDGKWLVSFYGRRVKQVQTDSLQEARFTLRRLAMT